jgi:hypothetical protein
LISVGNVRVQKGQHGTDGTVMERSMSYPSFRHPGLISVGKVDAEGREPPSKDTLLSSSHRGSFIVGETE